MRRLGRVGRPTVAASTVSARCVCQRCGPSARPESERPRPRLQRHAPRLDVIEYRGVPRSPRGHKNPRRSRLAVCSLSLHRIRCGSSCHRRGVCPRDIAVIAIRHWIAPFGAHVGFSRPRCLWQPCGGGTIPRRHESLTSRPTRISISCGFQRNYSSFCSGRSHIPTPIVSGFDFRPRAVAGSRATAGPDRSSSPPPSPGQGPPGRPAPPGGWRVGCGSVRGASPALWPEAGRGSYVPRSTSGTFGSATFSCSHPRPEPPAPPGSLWPSPSIPWPRSIASEARVT